VEKLGNENAHIGPEALACPERSRRVRAGEPCSAQMPRRAQQGGCGHPPVVSLFGCPVQALGGVFFLTQKSPPKSQKTRLERGTLSVNGGPVIEWECTASSRADSQRK